MFPKSGLVSDSISLPDVSVMIHALPGIFLDLLPFEAVIMFCFIYIALTRIVSRLVSLWFWISVVFRCGSSAMFCLITSLWKDISLARRSLCE